MAQSRFPACSDHAIHVDHDRKADRWDVVDEDGQVLGHRDGQREALSLAIREAQHRHGAGDDVVVCLEGEDGHYTLAWTPPA